MQKMKEVLNLNMGCIQPQKTYNTRHTDPIFISERNEIYMKNQLQILDNNLKTLRPEYYSSLNEPLTAEEIKHLEEKYGIQLLEDFQVEDIEGYIGNFYIEKKIFPLKYGNIF